MILFPSKQPQVQTTIFTKMSQLALDEGALNLSQGFPGFDCAPALQDLLQYYAKLDRDNAFKNLKAREDQLQAERNTQTDPPAAAEAPAADEAKTDAARVHLGAGLSRTPVFRSKKARNTRRLLRKHG